MGAARHARRFLLLLGACAGCTSTLAGKGEHVELVPSRGAEELVLAESVRVELTTGGDHELAAGSRWQLVGTIPAGEVFRPVDGLLLLRTDDNYEAFLVVSAGATAGVYVPYERLFVGAERPVPLRSR